MLLLLLPLALAVVACSSGTKSSVSVPSTTATTAKGACAEGSAALDSGPEASPPGDIPDDQAFVAYSPPSGVYRVKVPEGWSRSESGDHVTFTDKLNAIDIAVTSDGPPSVEQVNIDEVPALQAKADCFELVDVTTESRAAGPMVLTTYHASSAPNDITGKVVLDDVERYEIAKGSTRVTITLSGPAGSDNVDPWKILTDSFTWT